MNFIRRAGLYLVRKKGRMLLMIFLLFLMSISVLVGISFKESAEKELDNLRKSMASGFVLKVNFENERYHTVDEHGNTLYDGPMINEDMIEKICQVDGVKDYIGDLFGFFAWTDLQLKPGKWADAQPDENLPEEYIMLKCQNIGVCYCRKGEIQKYFRTGALAIVEGRNIEEGDHFKAVFSDWLAERNHLSVGNTFSIEEKEGNYKANVETFKTLGEPVVLEIVGLFHANFSQDVSVYTPEDGLIENFIYADMDTYIKLMEYETQEGYNNFVTGEYQTVEFFVEDPGQIDSIMQQIKDREDLDLENMDLEVDNTDYQAAAKPYQMIRIFAMALLALGLCGLGIILYLVLKLWMQGRKREIGILYSIGIKKVEILGQMLAECLLVSALALMPAFVLSGPMTDQCATAAEYLTAPKTDTETYVAKLNKYFVPEITKTASDKAVLDHTVSADAILFTAFFVCGISGISVILSFDRITGLEPRKLLM